MSKSFSGNDDSDFETIDSDNSDFGQADSENSETAANINTKTSFKKSSTSYKYKETDKALKESNLVASTLLSGSPTSRHDAVNSPENNSESLPIIPNDAILYFSNVNTNHTDSNNETQGTFFG